MNKLNPHKHGVTKTFIDRPWPLTKDHMSLLLMALAMVVSVLVFVGLLLTKWAEPNAIVDFDVKVSEKLANNRTDTLDTLSHVGSFLADTPVKIIGAIVFAGFMVYRWQRWHEAIFVGLTLMFEAAAFIMTTRIVGRPRPDVEPLFESTIMTGYPSGHSAAAAVYTALAVIVFWHTRAAWARVSAVVVTALIPVIVATARVYQGMHYVSDVVVGVSLGLASVWICYRILGAPAAITEVNHAESAPSRIAAEVSA